MDHSPGTPTQRRHSDLTRDIVVGALVALLPVVLYLRTLTYGFYYDWDDGKYVFGEHMALSAQNVLYWLKHQAYGLYSPFTMISLMIDRFLFGDNAIGYRVHNLTLFAVTGTLVYCFLRSLRIRRSLSAFLTCAWTLNPQRVESVVWITERKDVLAGVFYAGALVLFRCCKKPIMRMVLVSASILLACGAKSVAVSLPVALAAVAVWENRSYRIGHSKLAELALYAGVAIVFIVWYQAMMTSGVYVKPEPIGRVLLLAPRNLLWYVSQSLIPVTCNPIYPRVQTAPCTIVFTASMSIAWGAILFACWRSSHNAMQHCYLPFMLAFLATHIQTLGFVRFNYTDYADRYNYLPSILLLACAGCFLRRIRHRAKVKMGKLYVPVVRYAAAAYMLYLGTFSLRVQDNWRDVTRVFTVAADVLAPNPRAWTGLADTAIREGNMPLLYTAAEGLADYAMNTVSSLHLPEDLKEQQRCMNTAIACHAIFLNQQGRRQEALPLLQKLFKQARESQTKILLNDKIMKYVLANLSLCQINNGDTEGADESLRALLHVVPGDSSDYPFFQGLRAFLQEDLDRAQKLFEEALRRAPDDERIQANLAEVKRRLNAGENPQQQ